MGAGGDGLAQVAAEGGVALDRIISRTLAYALLTLLLGVGYAAVVLELGRRGCGHR